MTASSAKVSPLYDRWGRSCPRIDPKAIPAISRRSWPEQTTRSRAKGSRIRRVWYLSIFKAKTNYSHFLNLFEQFNLTGKFQSTSSGLQPKRTQCCKLSWCLRISHKSAGQRCVAAPSPSWYLMVVQATQADRASKIKKSDHSMMLKNIRSKKTSAGINAERLGNESVRMQSCRHHHHHSFTQHTSHSCHSTNKDQRNNVRRSLQLQGAHRGSSQAPLHPSWKHSLDAKWKSSWRRVRWCKMDGLFHGKSY